MNKCYKINLFNIIYTDIPNNIMCIKLYYEFNTIILNHSFKNEFLYLFLYQVQFLLRDHISIL